VIRLTPDATKKASCTADEKLGATRIASGLPVAYHGAEAVGWL